MPHSERPSGRRGFGRLIAAAIVPGGLLAVSCVSLMSLEHRPCPCATGYTCCEATQTCLEEPCIGETGGNGGNGASSGTGGATGSGGTSAGQGGSSATGGNAGTELGGAAGAPGGSSPQGGATSGVGGMAGEGGMGGAPEPEWQPVGPSPLDDPEARSEPDLELAPDGTPYLAFKSCTDCDISSATIVPVVERFDGSRWRLLPTDGLPSEIVATPALALWEDGTPYVLVDGQVSRFNGASWVVAVGAPLPGPPADESNFQIDQDGTVWVTLFDSARQEISVVRSYGDTWETIGLPVSGRRDGVRFVMGVGGVYLAHTDVDGDGVFVRTMMSGAWMGPELAGQSVDVALAPDGTLYVAIWQRESALAGAVRVLSGAVSALAELGTIGSVSFQAPSLEVSTDGTLYAVFLASDFVNVNRFDGASFRDVKSLDIGNGTSPALRLSSTSSVPFVAFQSGLVLQVKKYE